MAFSHSINDEERCKKFVELRKRIIQIKNKQGLPETDGRVQILNNLGWATASIISRLNTVLVLNQQPQAHSIVAKLIGLGRGDLKTPIEADLLFIRLSFVVLFQFQLETLLKNILEKITNSPPPTKYFRIVENILNELSLNARVKKFRTLNALAKMRNCLHSNGIHTQKTQQITVDGHKMRFVKGKTYSGGDLDEIHFLVNHVLTILEEILEHQIVQGLNVPVPSQFMPQITR